MKFKINVRSLEWWFWTVTLVFIIAALSGCTPGYWAVIVVSLMQVVFVEARAGSAVSFPFQVRIAYLASALLGLWDGTLYQLCAACSRHGDGGVL